MKSSIVSFKLFLKSGHIPTLLTSLLYFDFCFAIWVLNGAMAPYISEEFGLSPVQKGLMLSVPVICGALLRFPLGVLAQYIGRKWSALINMGMIVVGLAYGFLFVRSYHGVLIMGILLGLAGASFGVALSLGSGSFPPQYKGLAAGIAGAGNSGAIITQIFAPMLAEQYGWKQVYGFAIPFMILPMILLYIFAKEPPDREEKKLSDYLSLCEFFFMIFHFYYTIHFALSATIDHL